MTLPDLTPISLLPTIDALDGADSLIINDVSEALDADKTKRIPIGDLVGKVQLDLVPTCWSGSFLSFRWFTAAGEPLTPANIEGNSEIGPAGILVSCSSAQAHAGMYCYATMPLKMGRYETFIAHLHGPGFGTAFTQYDSGHPVEDRFAEVACSAGSFHVGLEVDGSLNPGTFLAWYSGLHQFKIFTGGAYRLGGGVMYLRYVDDDLEGWE